MSRNGLVAFLLSVSSLLTFASADGFSPEAVLRFRPDCVRLCTSPDWLVRHDEAGCRTGRFLLPSGHVVGVLGLNAPLLYQANSGGALPLGPAGAEVQSQPAGLGVCALEFGGAAVGTSISAVVSFETFAFINNNNGQLLTCVLAAYPTYVLTSAFLSGGGTHLVGRSLGHGRSLGGALVGGALGGLVGGAALWGWMNHRGQLLLPIGLVLPPLGAVLAYNVRRRE
jgi:hypothetical protein